MAGRLLSIDGSCASRLPDDATFHVMYVVEVVVLDLVLSCFCCCGIAAARYDSHIKLRVVREATRRGHHSPPMRDLLSSTS
jgi:hypothetical protein